MREIIDGTISILDRFCRKGVMGGPSHEVPDDIAFAYAQVSELLKSMTSHWNWRWTAITTTPSPPSQGFIEHQYRNSDLGSL